MELATPKTAQSITLSGRDGTELATPKTAQNARVALSLADRLLLRRFAVGDKNSKNSRGSSEDPVHAVDGHCMSADQLGQNGLITGTRGARKSLKNIAMDVGPKRVWCKPRLRDVVMDLWVERVLMDLQCARWQARRVAKWSVSHCVLHRHCNSTPGWSDHLSHMHTVSNRRRMRLHQPRTLHHACSTCHYHVPHYAVLQLSCCLSL